MGKRRRVFFFFPFSFTWWWIALHPKKKKKDKLNCWCQKWLLIIAFEIWFRFFDGFDGNLIIDMLFISFWMITLFFKKNFLAGRLTELRFYKKWHIKRTRQNPCLEGHPSLVTRLKTCKTQALSLNCVPFNNGSECEWTAFNVRF